MEGYLEWQEAEEAETRDAESYPSGADYAADDDEGPGTYDPMTDPRFPSASRGDVMAGPEELMALGITYARE